MQPLISNYGGSAGGVIVYDVRKRSLMVGPRQRPDPVKPIYVMVGGRLFALADGSFELLYLPPCDADGRDEGSRWVWRKLPELPFRSEHVTCYAVHRNGRTVFVSIGGCGAPATLSFDTAEIVIKYGECKWKHHGQWQLPFTSRAYYVPGLEAWVGLSNPSTIGHLCTCNVVPTNSHSADTIGQQQCPTMKISKEKQFSEVRGENHVGATLVYTGRESKFCLLECIAIQADLPDKLNDSVQTKGESSNEAVELPYMDDVCEDSSDGENEDSSHEVNRDRYRFFRLTTFSLQYDKNGDLTTSKSGWYRYYNMPHEVSQSMFECPVAFWM
ncbi:unnamed protein product [Urochloa humidicola]